VTARQKYEKGLGIRLPQGQWLYKGTVYHVPAGNGPIFPRATTPSGFSGPIFRATPRQLAQMHTDGHVPVASLRV
jgi:hypothetical protein